MRLRNLFFLFYVIFSWHVILGQVPQFTVQDTLRGSITPERIWWDVQHYDLECTVDPTNKSIQGTNTITYSVIHKNNRILQIDLQPPMRIEKVVQHGKTVPFESQGNAHFITLTKKQRKGRKNQITVHYSGQPKTAIQAPWDGGISWKKDANGNDFIASSCQGAGASLWWPTKDHLYDEPNSMDIKVTVPKHLMNVSNGQLVSTTTSDTTKTYHWHVESPINTYGVSINIGDYAYYSEVYKGKQGDLNLSYYALKDHLEQAKKHFVIVPKMLEAFEYWLGPYPFYKDGYKLVETPYLGMEHQSAIAYGNQFQNGYLGRDLSGTGHGLTFDFIIVHESGHEWFGNSISCKDSADLWIHEGFTSYAESLFLEYFYGKAVAAEYIIGTRQLIRNDRPIIGSYDVNHEGSVDMYTKGANIIHTLRQFAKNDKHWRRILKGITKTFYHNTVTTAQIEDYLSTQLEMPLKPFFDQYLRTKDIPQFTYRVEGNKIHFRFTKTVPDFTLPIRIQYGKEEKLIVPTTKWQQIMLPNFTPEMKLKVDTNFYVDTQMIVE